MAQIKKELKDVKLSIGMCTGGSVRAETVVSLVSAMIANAEVNIRPSLFMQIGGYVDMNRNVIASAALKEKMDYIMFIDADMGFPRDGILTLLKRDKDIIGANYNTRLDPASGRSSGPVTKMMVNDKPVSMLGGEEFPTEPFKCFAVATGFVLIKTEVFKKLKYPYFEATIDAKGAHTTEDVEFCRRANKAGIEVWCDPTIKMSHIGTYAY